MGTSSDHRGGVGAAWSRARTTATQWSEAGGGPAGPGVAAVVGQAVAALGASAAAAVATAAPALARLGGLTAAASGPGGLGPALVERGLGDLLGKPALELRAALIDYLAGDPVSRDDQLVRLAAE